MKNPAELVVRTHYVSNQHGWELELRQCYDPHRLNKQLRPVMIIPGYGMNAFIFSYNPSGVSMEAAWAAAGFDVWSVNLRNQGGSINRGGLKNYTLAEVATEDLPVVVASVLKHTVAEQAQLVDVVGCSLGGTFVYAYLALNDNPKLGSVVAIGAPLRWEKIHPLLKVAFSAPELLGRLPFYGTQKMARAAFPLIAKFPFVLRAYLHPEIVDTSSADQLTRAIEDPVPALNRQIGYWMRHRDLVIRGVNISQALKQHQNPLLIVIANGDGIVPRETAMSGLDAMGSTNHDVIEIGDTEQAYAHADLFISNHADQKIFKPIADWLLKQESPQVKQG